MIFIGFLIINNNYKEGFEKLNAKHNNSLIFGF